jgi:hypothetical protein
MLLHLITRWILSPLEMVPSPIVDDWQQEVLSRGEPGKMDAITEAANSIYPSYELPIVRQYCQRFDAPFHGDGVALVFCEMDVTHLAAARKDVRLVIFESLDDPFPQDHFDKHSHLVSTPSVETLRDFLKSMEERHVKFACNG